MSMQWRVVGIAVTGFVLAGCASSVSRMQPTPVRGQAELQRDRDVAQCGAFATKDRADDGGQDTRFAACMVSRGYRVTLPVRVGLEHGRVDIEARGEPVVAQVENDLGECVRQVERVGERTSSGEVVASRIGGLYRGNEPDRAHTARSQALEREFSTCFNGHGYVSAPSGGSR